MRRSKWSDVLGITSIEFEQAGGPETDSFCGSMPCNAQLGPRFARLLNQFPELAAKCDEMAAVHGGGELVVEFRSSGYYDSGSMYGGPDNLGWPPEGDEERRLDVVYLVADKQRVELSPESQWAVFDAFEDLVSESELELND